QDAKSGRQKGHREAVPESRQQHDSIHLHREPVLPLAEKIKSVVQNLLDGGRDIETYGPLYLFVVTNSSEDAMGDGSVNTFRMLKQLGRPELMPGIARVERREGLMAELEQARLKERLATV